MRWTLPSLLAMWLLFPTPIRAADDEPYRLQIVLHCAPHRMLTEIFREKLARELGDGVQAALGKLATVEVVTTHDRLAKIEALGLRRALDGWTTLSPVKTHFIQIDYVDSYYQVRGLQHDGLTGQAGPIVRQKTTRDRDFVARLAALMIDQDFGLVGTVAKVTGENRVEFRLQGPAGTAWSQRVHRGDVFALVRVSGETGQLLRSAYLRIETPPAANDTEGKCIATVANRFELPNLTEYRAIKLGTIQSPVRLRLIRQTESGALVPLEVPMNLAFRQRGFTGEEPVLSERTTDDRFDTETLPMPVVFDRLVYVTISSGSTIAANVPIPLVGHPEVLIAVSPSGSKDDSARVLREDWNGRVRDAYTLQSDQMQRIEALAARPDQRAETIKLIRRSLERTQSDLSRLKTMRAEIGTKVAEKDLTAANERLQRLQDGERELKAFLDRLEALAAKENSPERLEALTQMEQARQLVSKGEIRQALSICRAVLARGIDLDGSVPARIAELEKLEPKTPPHVAAWDLIYNTWPKLETVELAARFDEARAAFDECKKAGDRFGPRRLLDHNVAHALRMDGESGTRPIPGPGDERLTPAKLQEFTNKLAGLSKEIKTYLEEKP